jgi:tRNA pseudouridine55 synthase
MMNGSKPSSRVAMNGVLLLDKPEGMTSFAAADRVKRWLRAARVGHCGTLDPIATGLLVICLDQATRIADQLLVQDKTYRFTIHLGVETDTLDKTGRVLNTYGGSAPSEAAVQEAIAELRGRTCQQVPRFSAVKINGRRAYDLARKGLEVQPPLREVWIHRLDLIAWEWPQLILEARCSKGTYIRQLAADLGRLLECGGHVSQLRRLASGTFHVDQAVSLDELRRLKDEDGWHGKVFPIAAALSHLPTIYVEDHQVLARVRDGYLDPGWETDWRRRVDPSTGQAVRLQAGDQLVALWWPNAKPGERRLRVFSQ